MRKADKPWQHGLNSSSFWNISHAGETLQGNPVTPVSHLHTRITRRRGESRALTSLLHCAVIPCNTQAKKVTRHMQKVKHQVRKLSQVISLLRGQKTRRNATLIAIKHCPWLSLWVKGNLNWPCAGIISVLPDLTHPYLSHNMSNMNGKCLPGFCRPPLLT